MNEYIVNTYDVRRGKDERALRAAVSADDLVPAGTHASKTRRWQRSPREADRDNIHVQFDHNGFRGVAVWRADTDPKAAEHRNDVAVARSWIASGRTLTALQSTGGYASVTEADVQNITEADRYEPARAPGAPSKK